MREDFERNHGSNDADGAPVRIVFAYCDDVVICETRTDLSAAATPQTLMPLNHALDVPLHLNPGWTHMRRRRRVP